MGTAKVRGIYSTALTKLLLDHGFEIAQPSADVASRFGLETGQKDSDLNIIDRRDKQGIIGIGESWVVEDLRALLAENLLDVVVRDSQSKIHDCSDVSLDFEFPGYSKSRLDEIRGSVTSTICGHHFYKACGGSISSAVDMAENLITEGRPEDEVERLFTRTIASNFPFEESVIEIDHIKLDGSSLSLGKAMIEKYEKDDCFVALRRRLRGGGQYDGLGLDKRAGDYAVSEVKLGEWYLVTRYFSREGDLKGTYVNFSTPVELYPHRLRYVDLEVDICIWPRGGIKVLDMRFLKGAATEGLINTKLSQLIQQKTKEMVRELRHQPLNTR
ncbi:MAG: DUF402 domain-containing protein [Candidatus Bathyarchaeota archaeon]|nr:MAG: DUF402 domain-containing protein [Candidatus Bathyarchaeota archaeon]